MPTTKKVLKVVICIDAANTACLEYRKEYDVLDENATHYSVDMGKDLPGYFKKNRFVDAEQVTKDFPELPKEYQKGWRYEYDIRIGDYKVYKDDVIRFTLPTTELLVKKVIRQLNQTEK